MACFLQNSAETMIRIIGNRDQNGVTYYTIAVNVGPHNWTVAHRYREFRELHERLVVEHGISKDLLPPKKVIGNRAKIFLDLRQQQLELYLQQVLKDSSQAMSREFVEFLHFNRYDIVYLLQDMAQRFYLQGVPISVDQVQDYDFSVLELYAIAERLRMPCPSTTSSDAATLSANVNNWKCYDFTHVVEFCTQLDAMRVVRRKPKEQPQLQSVTTTLAENQHSPTMASVEESAIGNSIEDPMTAGSVETHDVIDCAPNANVIPDSGITELIGTSNIDVAQLRLDLGAFHALTDLTLDAVPPQQLIAVGTLRETLRSLTVRKTTMRRLSEVLLCDSLHWLADCSDTAKRWPWLTHLDAADNCLESLDASITLLPRLVRLRLDGNRISAISSGTLNQLPSLSELSLAGNRIEDCVDWHLELGNIRALCLARNGLHSLRGLRKMFSLVRLDVGANRLAAVDEVEHVACWPLLEELRLAGNPMGQVVGELFVRIAYTSLVGIIIVRILLQTTGRKFCHVSANVPQICSWTVRLELMPNWTWLWYWLLCVNPDNCVKPHQVMLKDNTKLTKFSYFYYYICVSRSVQIVLCVVNIRS